MIKLTTQNVFQHSYQSKILSKPQQQFAEKCLLKPLDKDTLSINFKGKVNPLAKRNERDIWHTTVYNTDTQKYEPVYIKLSSKKKYRETEDYRFGELYGIYNQDDRLLGQISLGVSGDFDENNENISEKSSIFEKTTYKGHVFIRNLSGSYSCGGSKNPQNQYKGVGTRLMQLAFQISVEEGHEGRILLESVNDSYYFYKKCGMKLANPEMEKKIKDCRNVSGKLINRDGQRIHAGNMYLESDGIKKFTQMNKKEPFEKTAENTKMTKPVKFWQFWKKFKKA